MPFLTPYLHKVRTNIVTPHLKGNVLDLDCGPANTIKFLKKDQKYVGVEHDKNYVKTLRKRYPAYNFYAGDFEKDKLNLKDKFDTILLIAVIEHLANPENIISECAKLLKQKGSFIVTTPTPFGNNVVHKFGAKIGLFSKVAVEDHKIIYDYKKMKSLLNKYGLKIVKYKKFELGCNQLFKIKIN